MLQEVNKDFVVGVVALQGGFAEHIDSLKAIGIKCCEVRTIAQAERCDAFILPGGESTVIWKLMQEGLAAYLLRAYKQKRQAIWGTCAGAIICSRNYLNLIDTAVTRNAYGAQLASCVTDIRSVATNNSLGSAVLIRAPKFIKQTNKIRTIAIDGDGESLALVQDRCLVTSFHPELVKNSCFNWHEFFVNIAQNKGEVFADIVL
jgi:5'-phosphate synthase pdxT subunit